MKRWSLTVILFLSLANSAVATTLRAFTLEELGSRSDLVVRARILDERSEWRGRVIHTLTHVEVLESFKQRSPAMVTVLQLGGVVGPDAMPVAGTAEWTPGSQVILFLRRTANDEYVLAGMSQGKLEVLPGGKLLSWRPTAPVWDGARLVQPRKQVVTVEALRSAVGVP